MNSNLVTCCMGRSAGLAPFKILFHVNLRAPIEVDIVHPVRHQAALIDELPLEVNSRQQVFAGELDDMDRIFKPPFFMSGGISAARRACQAQLS